MEPVLWLAGGFGGVSLLAWLYLLGGRGGFWQLGARDMGLGGPAGEGEDLAKPWPAVAALVPARNEVGVLPRTLPTLLEQDYPGPFRVFLVDDHSEDGTGEAARRVARDREASGRLTVVPASPLPAGWTGKVWALRCGLAACRELRPEFLLLTDADIVHPRDGVRALVARARGFRDRDSGYDLVSVMAHLRVATPWERLLIPAFVYFFALIYPFRWVREPRRRTAAAAGGCLLVRRDALERAGGLEAIAGELIDDCALAKRVKRRGRPGGGRLWLGFEPRVRSIRGYRSLGEIRGLVARTAFTQLGHSAALLVGAVLGLLLLFWGPPAAAVLVLLSGRGHASLRAWFVGVGAAGSLAMVATFLPTLKHYRLSVAYAPLLPLIAAAYASMTVESAVRHWRGVGAGWKGRWYGAGGRAADGVATPGGPRSGGASPRGPSGSPGG